MIEGTKIKIGDKEWIVPPLNFKALRILQPQFERLGLWDGHHLGQQEIDDSLDIILGAMNRNYPELTKNQLEEIIDLGNMKNLMFAIRGLSGLIPSGESQPKPENP